LIGSRGTRRMRPLSEGGFGKSDTGNRTSPLIFDSKRVGLNIDCTPLCRVERSEGA